MSDAPESPSPTIQANPETGEFVEVSELLHADAGNVQATHVAIEQSTAGSIEAESVKIDRSAIKSIDARDIRMQQSATGFLRSNDTAFHESAVGIVSAARIDLFGSTIGVVRGPVTVASDAESRVFIHIGGGENQPRPLLDGQSALTLGAGIGLSVVVLGRVLRRLLGS